MLLIQDKYVYRTPSSVAIYVTLFAIDLFVCNNEDLLLLSVLFRSVFYSAYINAEKSTTKSSAY